MLALTALTAFALLGTASVAAASQSEPELMPTTGSLPVAFSALGAEVSLSLNEGNTVKCKTVKTTPGLGGSGEFSTTTTGTATLTFRNCSALGTTCKSAGQATGTVVTEALPVNLEYREGEPIVSFGANESTGMITTFTCAWGLIKFEVSGGSVSGQITSPGFSEAASKIVTEELVGESLESSVNGGSFEAADMETAAWLSFSEDFELVGPPTGSVWLSPENPEFSVSGGESALEFGESTYTCGSTSGSGSILTENRAVVTLKLNECGGGGLNFTSPGQPSGTIVTAALRAEPVYLDAARTDIGLLLKPPTPSGVFAEWSAALGSIDYVTTGSLLVDVTDPDIAESSSTITFRDSETDQVEETGPSYGIQTSINNGPLWGTAWWFENSIEMAEGGEMQFLPVE